MFDAFLPSSAQQLRDHDAIKLLKRLHRHPITVPDLDAASATIPTALVTPEEGLATKQTPLLLLHGFDSSLLEFRHLIPRLVPSWPVYAMDLLGFGFTAHRPTIAIAPHTIRQHLYYTWKTLLNRPTIVIGASMGGAVALDFALTYPDCVERLVLIDSVGFSGSFPLGQLLTESMIDWGTTWLHLHKNTTLQLLENLPFVPSTQQDLVLCSSLHQEMPGWRQSMMSFTRSGGYGYLSERIAKVQQPTLILWGDRDKTLGTEDACKFKQALPHSRLVWVRGADHAPHIQKPEMVAAEILREIEGSNVTRSVFRGLID